MHISRVAQLRTNIPMGSSGVTTLPHLVGGRRNRNINSRN